MFTDIRLIPIHCSFRKMGLIDAIHGIVDRVLALVKLVQNREVGWPTVDRKSGAYRREQQPIYKKLKLLFLFSPLMEWIDRTHLLRLWIHDKTIEAGKLLVMAPLSNSNFTA